MKLHAPLATPSRADALARAALRPATWLAVGGPLLILVYVGGAAVPALRDAGLGWVTDARWAPTSGMYAIGPMVAATVLSSGIAVLLAGPMGVAWALHLACYANPRALAVHRGVMAVLAGLPSVVIGLAALDLVVPLIREAHPPGLSLAAAALTLAVMALPTIALAADGAFQAVDPHPIRAARALGLSAWDAARGVLLPLAWPGIRTALALGVGRAIGETMAVMMVAGNALAWPTSLWTPVRTLTATIAGEVAYAEGLQRSALYACALALFLVVGSLQAGDAVLEQVSRGFSRPFPPLFPDPIAKDRFVRHIVGLVPAASMALIVGILLHFAVAGIPEIDLAFFTEPASAAGREGGIFPMIVASLWLLVLGVGLAAPPGIAAAVYLAEYAPRPPRFVRIGLDLLAATPSVVYGLFGMALFCETLGFKWSILSGGLTVALMVLPLFVRISEDALRTLPHEWREAGAALGMSRANLIWRVLLPQAMPAFAGALALATGRVLAESAVFLLTAGASTRTPTSLLDPGRTLAVHVYQMAVEVPGGSARAAATALVLGALVSATGIGALAIPRLFRPSA